MAEHKPENKKPRTENGDDAGEDPELMETIDELQNAQDELEKVNEEASDKILEIEQQFNLARKPIFEKRNAIIEKIPDFWLTVFLSHPVLGSCISHKEKELLKHLQRVLIEDSSDVKSGHIITLEFSDNPFLQGTNSITRTYTFSDDGLVSVTVSDVKWKAGKNITVKEEKNEVEGAGKKKKRQQLEEEEEEEESFFQWFLRPAESTLLEALDDEYGEMLKEDVWPNPLKYFRGDGEEDDEDEFEVEDDEEEEDEEQDGAEDEEDDEEGNE